jgi:hypothetical protein
VPVLLMDLLGVLAMALDGLATELESVSAYSAKLDAAEANASTWPGVASAVACGREHVALVLTHLGNQVAPLNRLIGLVNGFLDLAGLPEKFRLPCIAALNPANLPAFVPVLRTLATILRTLAGQIPQPGGRKSRVVPC